MSDDDKTIRADDTVPSMSSGTHDQGGDLLTTGMMVPPQMPGILGTIGKYQVVRVLGEGGMGQVLLARDPVTDSPVAIKIIKPEYLKKDWAVRRFLNEARHMFKLAHPSIIRVLEVSDREEGPYFVMPFIAGGSLAQKIRPGESLPAEEILCVARQAAEALHYAHARGIIHRDLKPSNILLDADGRASLCDFGLLRTVFNDSIVDVTRPQMEGTVPYMSPAVAAGRAEDTRCDIYGFGCLLYEMLTGQPPYQGPTVDAILKQIQAGPPRPIRQVNPGAPAPLAAIAESAMARELRDRYAAMSDVIADLERVARRKAPIGPHGRNGGSTLGVKIAAAVGLAALLGLAAVGILKLSPGKPSAAATPAPPDANDDLKRGLVLHFNFDKDEPGGTVTDQSGLGNDGRVFGAKRIAQGKCGGAYAFDKSRGTDRIVVPNTESLNPRHISLAAWIKSNDGGGNWGRIIDKDFRKGYCLGLKGPEGTRANPEAGHAAVEIDFVCDPCTETRVDDGQWHHVMATHDGSVQRIYLDGQLQRAGLQTKGSTISPSPYDLAIGNSVVPYPAKFGTQGPSTSWAFNGLIDEVMIFDRALSPVEVKTLYRLQLAHGGLATPKPQSDAATPTPAGAEVASPAAQTDFTYTTNKGAITLTKYNGPGGAVTIPSTIGGLPVTGIGSDAFLECTNATSVTIPASVTSLGTNPFDSDGWQNLHSRLLSITVAPANPAYSSTPDGVLFNEERTCLVGYPGGKTGSYEIPRGVTSIGEFAFGGCGGLSDVTIPSTATNIGSWAFGDCTNLTRVAIPSSVTSVGQNAFNRCSRLTLIIVDTANPAYSSTPDGVLFNKKKTCLVSYPAGKTGAFEIPMGVATIGDAAFGGCSGLPSVTIPDSVTNIADGAFFGCSGVTNVSIPRSVTRIGHQAFRRCTQLTSLTIPKGVTSIGYAEFCECGSLTNVTIPSTVTSIDIAAFGGCSALRDVTIPGSVTRIGNNAFSFCASLAGVYFKGNAPVGGSDSSLFSGANNATVYYPPGATGWDKTFGGRPTATWELSEGPFNYAMNNGAITITKYTGPGGAVTIPCTIDGMPVTTIGDNAFRLRSDLTSVTIPDGVTGIGEFAFQNCARLSGATIPTSITGIGYWAFIDCGGLTNISIPAGVTFMGPNPFWGTRVTSFAVDPNNPAFSSGPGGVIFDRKKTRLVSYPGAKDGGYVIPDGVTGIADSAFGGCGGLSSITIPDSVTDIGPSAFHSCGKLAGVSIPDRVTNIGIWAFCFCSGLTNVTIPASVTSMIGPFPGCNRLESVAVDPANPAYSSSADGVVFDKDKTSLVSYPAGKAGSYVIPDGVRSVRHSAFRLCPHLTSLTIPASVTAIDTEAFLDCPGLTGVCFEGNAPSGGPDTHIFAMSTNVTVYYRSGTTGWGPTFGGRLTVARDTFREGPYTCAITNGSITITKYTGPGGDVTIPGTINGLPVTVIGMQAFWYSKLADVQIPSGVTSIGGRAFGGCHSLTNVTIPDSVTSIGSQAFYECSNLTNIRIPRSVTSIEPDWNGVNSIVVDAANPAYCSSADGALFNKDKTCLIHCPSGKAGSYAIPAGVKSIMDFAFSGCHKLTDVIIPNSVTGIGYHAFPGCASLTNVLIGNSVTSIEGHAFRGCRALDAFVVDAANPAYSGGEDGVLFDKGKTSLVCYPGGKAGSYEIPSRATKIGEAAFFDCLYLTSVSIPESVTRIGSEAFRACGNLTAIHFKGNAPRLDQDVFEGSNKAKIYYRPGARGWGGEFGGRPTAPWDPDMAGRAIPLPSNRWLKPASSDGAEAK